MTKKTEKKTSEKVVEQPVDKVFGIIFKEKEGEALVELLNIALKANGIPAMNSVSFWLMKMNTAEELNHGDTSPERGNNS